MSTEQSGTLLQCYNTCCGKTFDPSKNEPDSCYHHPGVPVFHDAYKGWSCCNKKTTDFTEFLNIKGCTRSCHSNVKPPEVPKPKQEVEIECDESVKSNAHPPPVKKEGLPRPSPHSPMHRLNPIIGASLKTVLEKMGKVILNEKDASNPANIEINTPCKHGGCKQVYKGDASNLETCIYHPGMPVFHEGLKFWTCCLKRTTDFDSFLEQVGCTTGDHLWIKQLSEEEKKTCRYDWHQTPNSVVISVFSKCPIPDLCVVEANPVKLCLHIVFGEERKLFKQEFLLYGVIDVNKSSVSFLGSKVEINLRKAQHVYWNTLLLSQHATQETNGSVEEDSELNITT